MARREGGRCLEVGEVPDARDDLDLGPREERAHRPRFIGRRNRVDFAHDDRGGDVQARKQSGRIRAIAHRAERRSQSGGLLRVTQASRPRVTTSSDAFALSSFGSKRSTRGGTPSLFTRAMF